MRPGGPPVGGLGPRVLVLKAGPDYPDVATTPAMVRYGWGAPSILDNPLDLDWTYLAAATATSGDVSIPRGRLVGGSGSINGQIFLWALPRTSSGGAASPGSNTSTCGVNFRVAPLKSFFDL